MIPEETLITLHGTPTPPAIPIIPILIGVGALGGLGLGAYFMKKTGETIKEARYTITQAIFPLIPAGLGVFLLLTRDEKWAKIMGIGLIALSSLMMFSPSIKYMVEK
ncbi:MAG: hypothetical protein QW734_03795 [Candidatus Bathyarchaeia archaeon]